MGGACAGEVLRIGMAKMVKCARSVTFPLLPFPLAGGDLGGRFLQVNGTKNESMITTKCSEIMSIASQVQNELNSK